ncbi:X-linked retinitis pigmentosa GTPase regulator-like isoform X2 [Poecilia formosa]|uniref:X-linked retinitis pigmentosa GTPase regulator-like isoform X2 n=1 Tax=Poecilia formosa TaxID=48698 RepID=UPI0007B8D4DF|nr:PREDICTED: X-linked retinitis pigmentosa GTPase regulator-like isoform X2 [Poecilia formosa]
MAEEAEDEIPESGAVFTFGKSKFADDMPSVFWLKNDVPERIACGDEHSALVTGNGKLFMFGSNNWGQLGLGSKQTVQKPTCVKALKGEKVRLVACGRNHTLISTERGHVFACGGNGEGQLGLGDCEERTAFQRIGFFQAHGPIKMLAAGSNTSAALTEGGKLFMWGENSEGQIGLGKRGQATRPLEVSVGRPVSWVSCGYYHSALVTADGALFTFGERDSGKLGLRPERLAGHRVPQRVESITEPVLQVACGGSHTVALTDSGDIYSFGLGQFGQLGLGTFVFESQLPRPVQRFQAGRPTRVTCGESHTAVLTDTGLLYSFGDGRHGKLGLGDQNFTNRFHPAVVPRFLPLAVQAAACGGCHMVVLAQPRGPGCSAVTLEDSAFDFLGEPTATLQRSLSARVRRRERERSPEQFGPAARSLPARTSGVLQTPLPALGQLDKNPLDKNHRPVLLPPSEPDQNQQSHRPVPNGSQHFGPDGDHQGQTGGDMESLTDCDSVRGLGETTDFLNLTHVMKMDPSDKTLSLSPLLKRKGKHAQPIREQTARPIREHSAQPIREQRKDRKFLASRALHTQFQKGSDTHSLSAQHNQNQRRISQNQQNLLSLDHKNKAVRQAGSKTQLTGTKPAADWDKHPEPRRNASKSGPAGPESKAGWLTIESCQPISDERNASHSKPNPDSSKRSKNERNRKEAAAQRKCSGGSTLAGAAILAAGGAVLVQQLASRRRGSAPKPDSDPEEFEYLSAEVNRKSAVSINVIPASESPQQEEEEEEEEEEQEEEQEEEKRWRTSSEKEEETGSASTGQKEEEEEEDTDSETPQPGDQAEEDESAAEEEEEEEEETSGATESENETEEKGSKGGDMEEEEEEEEEGSSQETQSKGAVSDEEEQSSLKSEEEEDDSDTLKSSQETEGKEEEEDDNETLKSSQETEGSEEEEEDARNKRDGEDEETEEESEEEEEEEGEEEEEEEEGEEEEEEEGEEEEEEEDVVKKRNASVRKQQSRKSAAGGRRGRGVPG